MLGQKYALKMSLWRFSIPGSPLLDLRAVQVHVENVGPSR